MIKVFLTNDKLDGKFVSTEISERTYKMLLTAGHLSGTGRNIILNAAFEKYGTFSEGTINQFLENDFVKTFINDIASNWFKGDLCSDKDCQ